MNNTAISPQLRELVKRSVAILGDVIRRELGAAAFRRVETIRRRMAALRSMSDDRAWHELERTLAALRRLGARERLEVVHSFALMLELMNACENAYRTHRLRSRPKLRSTAVPEAVILVLTAHPTEARSPENIAVFHEIQNVLVEALEAGLDAREARLRHLIEVVWRISIARRRKPRVKDEAEHIFSIVLREESLRTLIAGSREVAPIYVRTWVGGDKDGHPGVDETTLQQSLQLSRSSLIRSVRARVIEINRTLRLVRESALEARLRAIQELVSRLSVIGSGDGGRVRKLRAAIRAFAKAYESALGELHPELADLLQLTRLFPALVLPIELRESSDLIARATAGEPAAIVRMARRLKAISAGGDPRWYARGLIISMASTLDDVRAAFSILTRVFGKARLPVIPLFEEKPALDRSAGIVEQMLRDRGIRQALDRYWGGYLEIMVGYSDSAKEIGVLASRIAISDAIHRIDRICVRHRVTPIFFHGSGGSIDRGGGSIQEQTAWWPASSLCLYKATIQGEMVERLFTSPEVLRSSLERVVQRAGEAVSEPRASRPVPRAVEDFAARASAEYQARIASPEFLDVVQRATIYRYLSALRMGSRPSKRGGTLSVRSLRAIPWVLCWTQARVLFPTWWGIGTAWKSALASERRALKRAFERDPLFRTYVKALGFTLAKVVLPVWNILLENSSLGREQAHRAFAEFESEYRAALAFTRTMSGTRDLLWFRPWLGESIRLRAPMIHPLNLLQILAVESHDDQLLRETVTGIASGMMTTG